ncbi:MAG: hypothetical protein QF893_22055 [Alphaproteobacteria bacterium]|jgi:hypothetical protein|nr:hypothetical protein [Alphaproteobacteria bacterium]
MRRITVRTSDADYLVEAEAVFIGDDLLVYIWGGDRPHIGAVAAAQPRPSLADPDTVSATASVLTYLGHKEDEVVKWAAEAIAAALDTNVVVTAGIHWDDLSAEAVGIVLSRCKEIVAKLLEALEGEAQGRRP